MENATPIDVSTWTWGTEIEAVITKAVGEVLRQEFAESPPQVWLPFQYTLDGDPLRLNLELALGPSKDENAEWTFHLADIFEDACDSHKFADGTYDVSEMEHIIRPMIHGLRELADKLEGRIMQPPTD